MASKTAREAAESVIARLTQAGHQALLAGGCVRDLLLGGQPKDYDVATDATPQEICNIYPRAHQVGAHFGVVIVRQSGHLVEVATFRSDGHYADGRHPQEVTFTTAEQDALRRDFTINGMFYDVRTAAVIDFVGGQEDLRAGLVRAIGTARQRFDEDHLRMLRAVRFAARLDFTIEAATFSALRACAEKIRRVSRERVRDELQRILSHANRAGGFRLLVDTGLLEHLWEQGPSPSNSAARIERALAALPEHADLAVAYAAVMAGQPAEHIDSVCRDLTFSNRDRLDTIWLTQQMQRAAAGGLSQLADLKRVMAGRRFTDMMALLRAQLTADRQPLDAYDDIARRAAAIPQQDICPAPLVTGDDLIGMGLPQGPAFRRILEDLYSMQLNLQVQDREAALAIARQRVNAAIRQT